MINLKQQKGGGTDPELSYENLKMCGLTFLSIMVANGDLLHTAIQSMGHLQDRSHNSNKTNINWPQCYTSTSSHDNISGCVIQKCICVKTVGDTLWGIVYP